jgi:hypothetical protein
VLAESLARRHHRTGSCTVTLGDGSAKQLGYELRRSVIPGHHVWVLWES